MSIDKYIKEENEIKEEAKVFQSPSGKYSLEIKYYSTGRGTWNISRGLVKDNKSGDVIFDIPRNYSIFPFLFFERNKEEFLFAAEDYQGQSFFNLDKRERYDSAVKGDGFCWANCHYFENKKGQQTIVVEGCYWACSYQFKFFDASKLEEGLWPELEVLFDSYLGQDDDIVLNKENIMGVDGDVIVHQINSCSFDMEDDLYGLECDIWSIKDQETKKKLEIDFLELKLELKKRIGLFDRKNKEEAEEEDDDEYFIFNLEKSFIYRHNNSMVQKNNTRCPWAEKYKELRTKVDKEICDD